MSERMLAMELSFVFEGMRLRLALTNDADSLGMEVMIRLRGKVKSKKQLGERNEAKDQMTSEVRTKRGRKGE